MSLRLLIVFFVFFAAITNADSLDALIIKQVGFYKDDSAKASLSDIQKYQFTKGEAKNFGYGYFAVWSKMVVKNESDKIKTVIFFNPRPGIDYIDVYGIQNNELSLSYKIGDMNPLSDRYLFSRFSAFEVTLNPDEEITFFIRHVNLHGVVDTQWIAKDKGTFTKLIFFDTVMWGMLTGAFAVLFLYNTAISFAIKRQEFFLYGLLGLFALLGQLALGGVLYLADTGISLEILSSPEIFFISSLYFTIAFNAAYFNIKNYRTFKTLHLCAYIIVTAVLCLHLAIGFDHNGLSLKMLIVVNWMIAMGYLLFVGVFFSLRGAVGGWYYVSGLLCLFISSFVPLFALLFEMNTLFVSVYSFPLGMMTDFIFIALALNAKLIGERRKTEEKDKMLYLLSRFDMNGSVLNNIVHQWKLPISRLGSLFTELETYLFVGKPIEAKLREHLPQISYNLSLMKGSIKEFYGFYRTDEGKTAFNPLKEIKSVAAMLDDRVVNLDCTLAYEIDDDFSIYAYKNAFIHIFLVLLNNSLDAAQRRNIQNPIVTIRIRREKNIVKLVVMDNCGGISLNPVEKIFDIFESTNKDEKPRGSGLAIVKMLVKERLDGSIKTDNISNGCFFAVSFIG